MFNFFIEFVLLDEVKIFIDYIIISILYNSISRYLKFFFIFLLCIIIIIQVLDYFEYIDKFMDFEIMRKNIDNYKYRIMDEFEIDFELIIKNCMKYNVKDIVFYRVVIRFRDQVCYFNNMQLF